MSKPKKSPTPTPRTVARGYLQSDRVKLAPDALNDRESKVLAALKRKSPQSVGDLAKACFPGVRPSEGTYSVEKGREQSRPAAYRAVLNAMRRLVAARFVKKVSRGTYARVGGGK